MTFKINDRVKETCTSPGTGTITLQGAATQFVSWSAGIGANNTAPYVIADQTGTSWEVGIGTVGSGGTTLARTTVLNSSNSGAIVNFSSGSQFVWCDLPASLSSLNSWSTVSRPTSPILNQSGFNNTLGCSEYWNGSYWVSVSPLQYSASYLVVGGGGGGGCDRAGGGGGGAFITSSTAFNV